MRITEGNMVVTVDNLEKLLEKFDHMEAQVNEMHTLLINGYSKDEIKRATLFSVDAANIIKYTKKLWFIWLLIAAGALGPFFGIDLQAILAFYRSL